MEEISGRQEIFKVDRRGHVRVPRERREVLLDEFERCGVSAAEFAAHIGVKYSTFAHWRQSRERQRQTDGGRTAIALAPATPPSAMNWVEAIVEEDGGNRCGDEPANAASLQITLPGGARLEIATAAQASLAAELLGALESKRPARC